MCVFVCLRVGLFVCVVVRVLVSSFVYMLFLCLLVSSFVCLFVCCGFIRLRERVFVYCFLYLFASHVVLVYSCVRVLVRGLLSSYINLFVARVPVVLFVCSCVLAASLYIDVLVYPFVLACSFDCLSASFFLLLCMCVFGCSCVWLFVSLVMHSLVALNRCWFVCWGCSLVYVFVRLAIHVVMCCLPSVLFAYVLFVCVLVVSFVCSCV